MHRVHWLCCQPTPYNDFLFRSIAQAPDFELTVHYRTRVVSSHPWLSPMASGFDHRVYRRRFGLDWKLLVLAARDTGSFFVIGGWNEPTTMAVIALQTMRRRPFAFWTDTPRVDRGAISLRSRLRAFWIGRVLAGATTVMGTGTPALAALAALGSPPEKLVNFPYYVDLESFRPAAAPAVPSPLVFVSCGRLYNADKGFDLALRALALALQRTGTDVGGIRYRLAGTGPDADALASLASDLGLGRCVEFTGWLEPPGLPDFYRGGQVLLSPSHVDPYSCAVLEAMASGLAVVGSDATGAVLDRIRPGVNGLVHKRGDVEDLASQIALLLEDRARIVSMGAAARATAEQWPVSRGIAALRARIEQAVSSPGRSAPPATR